MASDPVSRLNEALERAEKHAPYLRILMKRFPDETSRLSAGRWDCRLPIVNPDLPLRQALRRAKAQQALSLAIADLAGLLSLEDVVEALSGFADAALDAAITEAINHYSPGEAPRGFAALALGKLGSGELNYSSDIDPILLFDPLTLPRRARDDPVEAAVRIGRRVVETLQARDGDGYVFRIDLRLRPSPEITPIVVPVDAAIGYYESQAMPWERAAFIRARACAGDTALGNRFLKAINPFIWRRGLDFTAIRDIRGISRRIRSHYAGGQNFGPGFDLKRGRGGIREIEFFAQIHQLIFGGREQALRKPATLDALTALSLAGRIGGDEALQLAEAYRLYRTIEHRLQMVDDQQTHALPKSPDALEGVAQLHGLANAEALLTLLRPHVDTVGSLYDRLDGGTQAQVSSGDAALETEMIAFGFDDARHAAHCVSHWRSGAVRALRTTAAREALEALLPQILRRLGAAPDPRHAINQLSSLIERLPSAINFFLLLDAQPALLKLLVSILSHAPALAEQLALKASLLDSLIDTTAFDPVGSVLALIDQMRGGSDLEEQLDAVRRSVGDLRFGLGVQLVEGMSDPLDVAKGYARVAEAAIGVVAEASIAAFKAVHGAIPGSELVILALGRLGGAELTHASDLDLIFLFTGDFAAVSLGAKPLGATLYYNRLAQRIIAGLSVPTSAGPLYDVDTRLRPSGAKGPLAVSLLSFATYQREEAWTWEHMALTRARPVYGSADARAATNALINTVLIAPRNGRTLIADAAKMRRDIAQHKPANGILDVKLAPGGLVDLEFAVHVSQLLHRAGFSPDLETAIASLSASDFLPDDFGAAHRLLTRMLVTLRLVAPDLRVPLPSSQALIAQACGYDHWSDLLAACAATRQSVADYWEHLSQPKKDL
jgi:[glutamine synthetase] adenylyltransferase / [glutamine synthetase]-adenylyl-L-tyrosine phosphorylase